MRRKSHILFSERKVGISLKCGRPGLVAKRLSNSSRRIMGNLEVTHSSSRGFCAWNRPASRCGEQQEKARAFSGTKVNGQFQFNRDKTVYVNHYYFYIDDEDFGPLFIKVCSYAPWGIKLCINGHEWAKRHDETKSPICSSHRVATPH